ncbi:MAG: hypothetical protein H0U52_01680 [Chloroflexi bacterium]|nr:hypothetical protein [Chloroflexota bacterium]
MIQSARLIPYSSYARPSFSRCFLADLRRTEPTYEFAPPTDGSIIATYTYDPLDRLRLVDYGGSNRVRFRYVGLTTSAAQTIDDQTGTVSRIIGTGWGGERQLDWTATNSNIRYYGSNAHHDTVWTASSTGAVSATLRYDPWGTLTASTGASLPDFRFQGSWFDSTTSIAWIVTRWYAPALGRFLSEDSPPRHPGRPAVTPPLRLRCRRTDRALGPGWTIVGEK